MTTPIPNLRKDGQPCFYYQPDTAVEPGAMVVPGATYLHRQVYYRPVAVVSPPAAAGAGFTLASFLPWSRSSAAAGAGSSPSVVASIGPRSKALTLAQLRALRQQWLRDLQTNPDTVVPYTLEQVQRAAAAEGRPIGGFYNGICQFSMDVGRPTDLERLLRKRHDFMRTFQDVLTGEVYQVQSVGHQLAGFQTKWVILSHREIEKVREEYRTYIDVLSRGLAGRRRKSSKSTKKHRNHSRKQKQ